MSELTPPPERPLSDEARARLRAEVTSYADANRSRAPRWAVPAGAAAAVALVAGMAWWAVGAGSQPAQPPVGGGTSILPAPSSTDGSTPAPSESLPTLPTQALTPDATATAGAGDCAKELRYVLKGATEVFGAEPFSYWVKGEQFSVCYQGEDRTTVTRPLPLAPVNEAATFAVASLFTADGQSLRLAGGVVPDGVSDFRAEFTFPDGHTEPAVVGTDAQGRSWWRMAYGYEAGTGSEADQPRIHVVATLSPGFEQEYDLEWGVDTCAQANHGC